MITNMRYHAILKKDKKKFIVSLIDSWHSHTRHFPQLYSTFPSSKFTHHRINISFTEIYPVGFGFVMRKSVFNLSSAFISDCTALVDCSQTLRSFSISLPHTVPVHSLEYNGQSNPFREVLLSIDPLSDIGIYIVLLFV